MRSREIQQQPAVDDTAVFAVKFGERGDSRLGTFSADLMGELEKILSGNPDDPDTATTLRRGNGGDCFSGR